MTEEINRTGVFIYVTNSGEDTVSKINGVTNTVMATIKVSRALL